MKRFLKVALLCALALFAASCASAAGLGTVMKASDAAKMPEDARVVVKGQIKAVAAFNRYSLEDASGEVVFEAKPKRFGSMKLAVGDVVEVAGEMDSDSMYGAKIEAYAILKEGEPVQYATVAQALKMPDDTWTVVKGTLKTRIDDDKFTFADESGEMVVEIDDDNWWGVRFTPGKLVELRGEIDISSKGIVRLDADFIREL